VEKYDDTKASTFSYENRCRTQNELPLHASPHGELKAILLTRVKLKALHTIFFERDGN
jgi:hypothetical protein